jgi:hypothetical protein
MSKVRSASAFLPFALAGVLALALVGAAIVSAPGSAPGLAPVVAGAGCGLTAAQDATIATGAAQVLQIACPYVALESGTAGSVCQAVYAVVAPLVTLITSADVAAAAGCGGWTPIAADGAHGLGVVCASFCGDMSTATARDPCPRVDAALAAAVKSDPALAAAVGALVKAAHR